ncbi:10998_t:CDS:2 [Entrophospora sp. SA101]|nr:10998_t:CDS:2 [Entrophospora sp. SA101]CAJ0825939.1 6951_t:CDS:2 [Entrophospora sp. SA101]
MTTGGVNGLFKRQGTCLSTADCGDPDLVCGGADGTCQIKQGAECYGGDDDDFECIYFVCRRNVTGYEKPTCQLTDTRPSGTFCLLDYACQSGTCVSNVCK